MKTIEQIAAEVLVKQGYALTIYDEAFPQYIGYICVRDPDWHSETGNRAEKCEPFADTLEGRKQSDAIEDWLYSVHEDLWEQSHLIVELPFISFKWRLDRIKWCLEQLRDEE